MSDQEDFNLNDLNDEDLVAQVHDDLYNGLKDEVVEATNIFLSRGWAADKVLNDALVEGMRIVGIDFRDGILFVPEVLLAANAMKAGMELLRPLLAETGVEPIGKVVIGTVKGDIHDIGKNLVSMMLEGAGFEVINIGINNPVENYLAALEEHQPDILGMSALLTTTMPYMKVVIDTLKQKGLRDKYIVLVDRRRRRRLLPRCGCGRGNREVDDRRASCGARRRRCRPLKRQAARWQRGHPSSSSPAVLWRAKSSR
jgi:methanogenic corrinoid protein MtbC1